MLHWTVKPCPHSKPDSDVVAARYSPASLGTFLSRKANEAGTTTHRVERGIRECRLDLGISIKSALGKLEADPNEVLAGIEPAGFNHLAIVGGHVVIVVELPPVHRDTFDR